MFRPIIKNLYVSIYSSSKLAMRQTIVFRRSIDIKDTGIAEIVYNVKDFNEIPSVEDMLELYSADKVFSVKKMLQSISGIEDDVSKRIKTIHINVFDNYVIKICKEDCVENHGLVAFIDAEIYYRSLCEINRKKFVITGIIVAVSLICMFP